MKYKKFDYYIFIDYSENLIGYNIISYEKIKDLLPRIRKLSHYKKLRHKKEYIISMKKLFVRERINFYLKEMKINNMRNNLDIFTEVSDFIKKNENCIIFVSIDNFQYNKFIKILNLIDRSNVEIVKESQLKKDSVEYRLSLIIDTQLNIERRQNK